MGLGALTYALHRDVRPGMVVVTDINEDRLARAESLFPPKEVKEKDGIDLYFVNTANMADPAAELRELTGGTGFDDVFCYAPIAPVVELSSAVLGRDGCLNFFAGPTDKQFSAKMNFYDVHYNSTHVMGTTGGNTADMIESLELTAAKRIDPAVMVTHIGGLNAAAETTLNLPKIPGGKKLIYTHLTMPLIALTDLRAKGEQDNDPAIPHWLTSWMPTTACGARKQRNICWQTSTRRTKRNVPWDRTNADRRNPHGTTPQSDRGTGEPQRQH